MAREYLLGGGDNRDKKDESIPFIKFLICKYTRKQPVILFSGSIHLLISMAMEYIFLAVESRMAEIKELEIWKNIKSYATTRMEGRSYVKFLHFDASMLEYFLLSHLSLHRKYNIQLPFHHNKNFLEDLPLQQICKVAF